MGTCRASRLTAVVLAVVLAGGGLAAQQLEYLPWILKYNSGQNIQPIFHGWSERPGGGFRMHFGYLNRNYVEHLHVPVGENNSLDLDAATHDQGQPTFFYPRFHNFAFGVDVPADWGDRELVWAVTVNGRTDSAVAWLQPEWEISDPAASGTSREPEAGNEAPTITVEPVAAVTLPEAVAITTGVADDGLPMGEPAVRALAVGQETPPTLLPGPDSVDSPVNVPQIPPAPDRTTAWLGPDTRPKGVSVSWIVWRGPAPATFDPVHSPDENGRTTTTATFTQPGAYELRATATDRDRSALAHVTVTVRGE